jgi:hypothetical protein
MPLVGNKKYPYTPSGMSQARKEASTSGKGIFLGLEGMFKKSRARRLSPGALQKGRKALEGIKSGKVPVKPAPMPIKKADPSFRSNMPVTKYTPKRAPRKNSRGAYEL